YGCNKRDAQKAPAKGGWRKTVRNGPHEAPIGAPGGRLEQRAALHGRRGFLAGPGGRGCLHLESLPSGDPLDLERDRRDVAAQPGVAMAAKEPAALGERAGAVALVEAEAGSRGSGAARAPERLGRGASARGPRVPPGWQGDRAAGG